MDAEAFTLNVFNHSFGSNLNMPLLQRQQNTVPFTNITKINNLSIVGGAPALENTSGLAKVVHKLFRLTIEV